jgi:catechol 2,3-dioxygenase-like lactoylglutathione lyase family enzyme
MHVSTFLRISTTVADLRRAAAFYRDALGFVPGDETTIADRAWTRLIGLPPAVTARTLHLRLGAQEIELAAFDPPGRPYPACRAANDPWFQHIAIVVDDMAAAFGRLQRVAAAPISKG